MGDAELYRLLRESVRARVPVGFAVAVALRSIDLIERLERSRDCADAAYKQN
jgi:hypothetical protein